MICESAVAKAMNKLLTQILMRRKFGGVFKMGEQQIVTIRMAFIVAPTMNSKKPMKIMPSRNVSANFGEKHANANT